MSMPGPATSCRPKQSCLACSASGTVGRKWRHLEAKHGLAHIHRANYQVTREVRKLRARLRAEAWKAWWQELSASRRRSLKRGSLQPYPETRETWRDEGVLPATARPGDCWSELTALVEAAVRAELAAEQAGTRTGPALTVPEYLRRLPEPYADELFVAGWELFLAVTSRKEAGTLINLDNACAFHVRCNVVYI